MSSRSRPPGVYFFLLSALQVEHVIVRNHPDVVTLLMVKPHKVFEDPFHQLRDASTWITSLVTIPPSTP